MKEFNRKEHWENVFQTKNLKEVSWYQQTPETSLDLIRSSALNKNSKIIDVGGGNSLLVDFLLEEGYNDITVLDISETAVNNVKNRLGPDSDRVQWIISDVVDYNSLQQYDVWHDRAAFHFLTEPNEIENYVASAKSGIRSGGYLIIGAFSKNGPEKCSGIPIKQYSEKEMAELFEGDFVVQDSFTIDHTTPSGKIQNFTFCRFIRTSL